MTEPENFIARWSRRKAAETNAETERIVTPSEPPSAEPGVGDEKQAGALPAPAQSKMEPPEIDLAALPPIESIGVGTDISVFLRAGVPAELTRAALRRAWTADPAIRDFIGLSENAWDFTAPDGVPGFGPLSGADAGRLMAEFTGKAKEVVERISAFETPTEPGQAASQPSKSVAKSVALPVGRGDGQEQENEQENTGLNQPAAETEALIDSNLVHRNNENNAMQHDQLESADNAHPVRRTHGSALPE